MRRLSSFLLHRLVSVIVAVLLVLTIEFVVFRVLEGPVILPRSPIWGVQEQTMQDWDTDEPLLVQYGVFMKRMLTGDFGTSLGFHRGAHVSSFIYDYVANSAALFAFTAVLSVAVGALAGKLFCRRKTPALGRFAAFIELFLWSVPVFIISVLFMEQVILRFSLDWPLRGAFGPEFSTMNSLEKIADYAKHALLPVLSVLLATFGSFALVVREGRVRAAKQAETEESQAITSAHVGPVHRSSVSRIFGEYAPHSKFLILWVLSCVMVTEFFFSWSGIGELMSRSIMLRDFITAEAAFFLIAILGILSVLAWDILLFISANESPAYEPRPEVAIQTTPASSDGISVKLAAVWREYKNSATALVALCVFLVLGVIAMIGPLIVKINFGMLGASSPDPVSFFVQGGRGHFLVALLTVLVSIVAGVLIGALALVTRWLDRVLTILAEAFLVVPVLPLVLSVTMISFYPTMNVLRALLLLCLIMWAPVALVVRNRAMAARRSPSQAYRHGNAVWMHLRDALSVAKYIAVVSLLALTFLELMGLFDAGSWGEAFERAFEYAGFGNLDLIWVLPTLGVVLLGISFYKVLEHLERALTKTLDA